MHYNALTIYQANLDSLILSSSDESIYDSLNNMLPSLAALRRVHSPAMLSKDLHIWPDYHGNRSPLADPMLKGMVSHNFRFEKTIEVKAGA